jgi:signal transduction histidine kinase
VGKLAALRQRFGSLRLSSKLAWLSAGLTAVFVATTFIPLSLNTRDTARQIVARQLGQTQRALIVNQTRELQRIEHAATLIGQNSAMLAAIADVRTQSLAGGPRRGLNPVLALTVRHELEKELRNVDQDLIVIADDSGRVFAAASSDSAPLAEGSSLASLEAVKVALDPEVPADTGVYGVLDIGSDFFSIAAVPLVTAGRTLGVVLLGERVDSAYLTSIKSVFDGDVMVAAGNRVIATTRSTIDHASLERLEAARLGGAEQPTIQIGGEAIVAAPLALGRDRAGAPVTLWLLQRVLERSGVLTRQLVWLFLLYGLAAVILSGLGAALVAQSVLKPLDRFIAYMKGVNPARPAARIDLADASPEIRTLDDSFASLMDSLRESEEQLRQSQKLEAVGTLAGGVAHDFNNLLTVITGYTELAMMRNDPDDRLRKDLVQVIEASQRAARLTHQLLAFSRKQVLQPTVLDVNDVVETVVPMLRRLIGEHIRISVDTAPDLGTVVADRGQLEQVIINLVVNARDAMPGGGTITVRTAREAEGGEAHVALAVSDTGTGIAPEVRDRIFEPFFTTKEPGKGTGLGLSMIYGIVKQSGGTIEVDTEAGRGTTFTVHLPAGGDGEAVPAESARTEIPHGTETVLLVEDEPELRELGRRTLESLGYTVIAPEHTEDALAIAISHQVDLLLTDIVMPVMSGPMIVRRLADVGTHPAVVYMSGYADETLAEYRLEAGATLLRKPFSSAQLARVVRSALDLAVR